jgi:hypothetical protein
MSTLSETPLLLLNVLCPFSHFSVESKTGGKNARKEAI